MSKNTMIAGSKWFDVNAIDPDFIEANENLESMGTHHRPISSALILGKFRDKARELGITLLNEQARLKKDGRRYMYTAEVEDADHPDYHMSVGFMNHSDRTKAFVGAMGSSILVCENKLITNVVIPSRQRHTVGNYDLIGDKVSIIFDKFLQGRQDIHGQISAMKAARLNDDMLGRFMLEAHRTGRIGASNIFKIVDDAVSPELNSRDDSSMWRLSNAATKVATHVIRSPERQAETSKLCHDIIMKLIDPGYRSNFTGFGEPEDAEVVDAEVVAA